MLGVRNYSKEYISSCRKKISADLSAYKKLASNAKSSNGFEMAYFNNMAIVLDHLFVHRLRTVEGKDGNPLNEVRLIGDAIMNNNGVLETDNTIKYDPAKSVLKYKVGDEIKLTEADFRLLYKAFFAEIENKFL